MVISKDAGGYIAGNLPSGTWTVQARRRRHREPWSQPVAVSTMGTVEANVAMTELRKPDLAAAWPRRMPEDSPRSIRSPTGTARTSSRKAAPRAMRRTASPPTAPIATAGRASIDGMRVNMKTASLPADVGRGRGRAARLSRRESPGAGRARSEQPPAARAGGRRSAQLPRRAIRPRERGRRDA